MKFPTEWKWKVIKFHGSKPPTRYVCVNQSPFGVATTVHIATKRQLQDGHARQPCQAQVRQGAADGGTPATDHEEDVVTSQLGRRHGRLLGLSLYRLRMPKGGKKGLIPTKPNFSWGIWIEVG